MSPKITNCVNATPQTTKGRKHVNILPKTNKMTKMTIIFFQQDKNVFINFKKKTKTNFFFLKNNFLKKKLKTKEKKSKKISFLFLVFIL
jgi:hypothetical protein